MTSFDHNQKTLLDIIDRELRFEETKSDCSAERCILLADIYNAADQAYDNAELAAINAEFFAT